MPRKPHKYHYLYKTTNLINNKFYVGMHSTSNMEDGYLGSGKYLKRSIKKYGKENFKIEYLEFFETRELLIEGEKRLINENILSDLMCMNIKPGGSGGFNNKEHQLKCSAAGGMANSLKLKTDLEYKEKKKKFHSNQAKMLHLIGKWTRFDWTGKKHKQESKDKIGLANSIYQKGDGNSQYGTCWITNNFENKKIKKEELDKWLSDGWFKGRKMNFID